MIDCRTQGSGGGCTAVAVDQVVCGSQQTVDRWESSQPPFMLLRRHMPSLPRFFEVCGGPISPTIPA
jgi:hypothetical protein